MPQIDRAIFFLLAVSAGYADVTVRYKSEMKPNPGLPAQMVETMGKGVSGTLPPESVLQIKGDKAYSTVGAIHSIVDMKNKQVTAMDPEKQQYGTSDLKQFAAEAGKLLSDLPPEARAAMGAMKMSSESRITGRTETIQGVEAEEREATMSIEGPPIPNMPPGPMIKMVMQFWTAKAGQEERNPALQELMQRRLWDYETMSPASIMQSIFHDMPGMGEGLAKFVQDMRSANSIVLRTSALMWMPSMVEMMKQIPADQNPFGDKFDATAPIFELRNEVVEISTAAIPDSVFEVPADYKAVPIGEILKNVMSKTKSAAQAK
jgi:malate synthase